MTGERTILPQSWHIQDLARVHNPTWVDKLLDLFHKGDAHVTLGVLQCVCFHRADAMLGRNRSLVRRCGA